MSRHRLGRLLALTLVSSLSLAACGSSAGRVTSSPSPPPGQPYRATVDATTILRTVDSGAILGGNLGLWVRPSHLASPADRYVTERGARVLRFPGGQADVLCWETMRVANGNPPVWDDWRWATTVDDYLSFLRVTGGVPLYGLNFFDHTIDGQRHDALAEARRVAGHLVAAGFRGGYYEVGNELDQSTSLDPEQYAERFVAYAEAVKAVDPQAQMMGPVWSALDAKWRDSFIDSLARRGKLALLDVFSFHYYGGWFASWNSDTIDLAKPQMIGTYIQAVRERFASVGAPGVRVAVTEYNAGIWDKVTRGQNSIQQALWLADACGELFRYADLANVWIDLSGVTDHALLDDNAVPPRPTTNYWPMLLAGQTLGFGRRDPAVAVLAADGDLPMSRATIHAVRSSDGRVGILLVNKGEALSVEIALGNRSCSTLSARRIDEATTLANSASVTTPATCGAGKLSLGMPRLSAIGIVLD